MTARVENRPDALLGGLPGPLPEGEIVLWQGRPEVEPMARHALHQRLAAAYFVGIALYSLGMGLLEGRTALAMASSLLVLGAGGLAAVGLIRLFARLVARTTVYTITSRRVVMRIGVALPITLNVPFAIVRGAGLKVYADGTGDIPLTLGGSGRISYLSLWPHARPWRLARPEPMLRAVPKAREVASILARAIGDRAALASPVASWSDPGSPPRREPAPSALAA